MTQLIFGQMAEVMSEVTAIAKSQRNQQQGFRYRGIDDVYNMINPILARHGVFMTSDIVEKSREERTNDRGTVLAFTTLRMRYRFWAKDGSFVETTVEGEGMDSGDKSSNKAMAIAHKYALLQAFCVPTRDMDDPDADHHQLVGNAAPAKLRGPPDQSYTPSHEEVRQRCDAIRKDVMATNDAASLNALYVARKAVISEIKHHDTAAHDALLGCFAIRKRELTDVQAAE